MSTDAYLDAKAAFERIDGEIDQIARDLGLVAQSLSSNRSSFSFTNSGIGLSAPALMGTHSQSFDGNNWLSAKQIMEKLASYHSTKDAMFAAWKAIPHERQKGLVPPTSPSRRAPGPR